MYLFFTHFGYNERHFQNFNLVVECDERVTIQNMWLEYNKDWLYFSGEINASNRKSINLTKLRLNF